MRILRYLRAISVLLALFLATNAFAATRKHKRVRQTGASTTSTAKKTAVRRTSTRTRRATAKRRVVADDTTRGVIHTRTKYTRRRRHVIVNPWTEPTFADSTIGDSQQGEDPVVRKAAVDALGQHNGSVVVVDAQTGRILTMVNQKLGLTGAYQPCSTIKVVISLASLSEGIVDSETPLRLTKRYSMTMTQALAHSNNLYFSKLGQELGFDRVVHYAKLFGLGEKAGYDIPGEQPGTVVDEVPTSGVGMMTSFGDGIRLTPLELASIVSTVANGGTMYYLQYPRSKEEIENFTPKIKRHLDIAKLVPEVKPGMMAAVEYGTARRANFDPDEPLLGKTGTCTDTTNPGVHLGWFGSFNEVGKNKIVVVVLLTGGRGVSGPIASGVAGAVYKNLASENYFAQLPPLALPSPLSLVSMQNCCR